MVTVFPDPKSLRTPLSRPYRNRAENTSCPRSIVCPSSSQARSLDCSTSSSATLAYRIGSTAMLAQSGPPADEDQHRRPARCRLAVVHPTPALALIGLRRRILSFVLSRARLGHAAVGGSRPKIARRQPPT